MHRRSGKWAVFPLGEDDQHTRNPLGPSCARTWSVHALHWRFALECKWLQRNNLCAVGLACDRPARVRSESRR